MSNELATNNSAVIKSLVLSGDLSKMNDEQKVQYYKQFCDSLGLNPLTQPFRILKLSGKEMLYATKDAAEQLRKVHGISIIEMVGEEIKDCYRVTAKAKDRDGKTDVITGVVYIKNLSGEPLANAMMKAETKAKRRVTLSIAGLGMLDETEVEAVQDAVIVPAKKQLSEKAFGKLMEKLIEPGADIKKIVEGTMSTCELTDEQSQVFVAKVSELETPAA
jgi:hypothetical protein